MRSYKSIERPAQVLGVNMMDLGALAGLTVVSAIALGLVGLVVEIPRLVYLADLAVAVGLFYGLRYLSKHKAPGFLMSWFSFTFAQPRRIQLGLIALSDEQQKNKSKNRRV